MNIQAYISGSKKLLIFSFFSLLFRYLTRQWYVFFLHFLVNLVFIDILDDESSLDDRKKRPRTAFTAAQIKALEQEFERNKYLSVSKRLQLSKQLKLTETQVEL